MLTRPDQTTVVSTILDAPASARSSAPIEPTSNRDVKPGVSSTTPHLSVSMQTTAPTVAPTLLGFFSTDALLTFRTLSKSFHQLAQHYPGPYTSKATFVTANSLLYRPNYESNQRSTFSLLTEAWTSYTAARTASSNKPAMLYKLLSLSNGEMSGKLLDWFRDGDADLVAAGRQYCPVEHNWDLNSAWVLAQIHRGRAFTLLSNLNETRQIMRTHGGKEYSAFTREVACAMKANYTINHIEYQFGNIIITLTPPTELASVQPLNIRDVVPSDAECTAAVQWIAKNRSQYELAIKTTSRITMLLDLADECIISELDELDSSPSTDSTDSDNNSEEICYLYKNDITSSDSSSDTDADESKDEDTALSKTEVLAFQGKINVKFTAVMEVLAALTPVELSYFIQYYNRSRLSALTELPVLPEMQNQATFFKTTCRPEQITAIFSHALQARLAAQLLIAEQNEKISSPQKTM